MPVAKTQSRQTAFMLFVGSFCFNKTAVFRWASFCLLSSSAVPWRYCRVHFAFSQHLWFIPAKKSVFPPPGQSDYEHEILQSINEYIISCACVALCRAGAFCLSDFWTLCPEVRSGSPGCRSPPAPHFVSAQPINRNKMEDKLWQRSIWKIFIIGT